MGTNAKVSIDPKDPSQSVLIPGIPLAIYVEVLMSGLLAAVSLGVIISR